MAKFVVERLDPKRHDRKGFECKAKAYTDFLQKYARQNDEIGFSATYVGVVEGQESEILGYMTLSMGHVNHADVEPQAIGHLPPFPIPVLHLGMLATSVKHGGKMVGPRLVRWAMLKSVDLAAEVGCHALQLKAAEDSLVAYYESLDFIRMCSKNRLMYLPVATIKKGLSGS